MASVSKAGESESYRKVLNTLRARLRGDLDQMSDEALAGPENSGNLSNLPIHLADVGTELYDQEFTLSLMENEQSTLDQIDAALSRIDSGTYGRCEDCDQPIAKARLQALPYTSTCIECARTRETHG